MYFVPGSDVVPYHVTVAGDAQPGVFLGTAGVVAWGFTPYENAEFGKYWLARLLGPNSQDPTTGAPLHEGEVTGFLRINV